MKLFLSSLAISDTGRSELNSLIGKKPADIKLALIENAADPYDNDHRQWVTDNRRAIQSHGYDVQLIDLRDYKNQHTQLEEVLADKDVIWLGGGNTFYLRWILHDMRVDQLITELVQRGAVYGGGSAGAIIAGPTLKYFEAADDPTDAPKLFHMGLGLTKTVVVPHSDNPKFSSTMGPINDKLTADGYKTVPLGDAQALVIDGDLERVI